MPLTDAKARAAKGKATPYKLTDGHGLHLLVKPNGTRLWRYRYRIGGKENLFAIGEYPDVGLQAAREAREAARRLVEQCIHPAHHRKVQRATAAVAAENTFEAVALGWIARNRGHWTPTYLKQVETSLSRYVFPRVGRTPVRDVTAAQLLPILEQVSTKGVSGRPAPNVALLIRQWCSAIFNHAISILQADTDPTIALRRTVKKPKTKHKKALVREEIATLVEKLGKSGGSPQVEIAVRLLLLTFVRPIELQGSKWEEFDLDRAVWRIPASRMKMREAHIVPLSTQAVELVQQLKLLTGNNEFLFPNVRDPKRPMSNTTMNRRLERMGYAGTFSSHGFRATASTLLNECGWYADVIERQLAHKERDSTRASYNHAEYMEERTKMMQQWADMVDGLQPSSARRSRQHSRQLAVVRGDA